MTYFRWFIFRLPRPAAAGTEVATFAEMELFITRRVRPRYVELVPQIDPSVPQPVFTITKKAPTRAFSWLKAPTSAFTFKTLLRHNAKRVSTVRSLNVKLGPRRNYHKGRAAIRHYVGCGTEGHRAAGASAGADFTDGFHCSGALICRQQETQLQGHSQ